MRLPAQLTHWWPRPYFSLFLLVLWLLLVNSAAPGQILLGAGLAWLIPFSTQQFWPERPRLNSPGRLLVYLMRLLVDILRSNLTVARLILRDPGSLQPGFVRFPLSVTNEFAITLLASSISLTPGTVSAGLSPDRGYLLVHVLHLDDEAELIEHIRKRYETPLREILE
ncbi:Na+/H+ antiporter subunit E [Halomonadaceae bacterium KBTZ08]